MCLDDAKRIDVAEDMLVYKILTEEDGKYWTPYQYTQVTLKKTYRSTTDYHSYFESVYRAIHSFALLDEAIDVVKNFNRNVNLVIVEAWIPKNSKAYVGSFYWNWIKAKCYASTRLRYTTNILYDKSKDRSM